MPNTIPLWPDLPPGNDSTFNEPAPSLSLYLLQTPHPTGMVIVLPGGGYEFKADYEGYPIAEWFNQSGIAAAVLDYRVTPYHHPFPLIDAKRAIQIARTHADDWNIDPNHVAILGFSAGGHLAASTGTLLDPIPAMPADSIAEVNSRPDALILCYPVISFGKFGHIGSMENLLGKNPTDPLRRQLSLELQVSRQTPPAFIWHTATDEAVPVENSLLFAQALKDNQVPFELHIFPEGPHGMALAWDDPQVGQWRDLCINWLKKSGF